MCHDNGWLALFRKKLRFRCNFLIRCTNTAQRARWSDLIKNLIQFRFICLVFRFAIWSERDSKLNEILVLVGQVFDRIAQSYLFAKPQWRAFLEMPLRSLYNSWMAYSLLRIAHPFNDVLLQRLLCCSKRCASDVTSPNNPTRKNRIG